MGSDNKPYNVPDVGIPKDTENTTHSQLGLDFPIVPKRQNIDPIIKGSQALPEPSTPGEAEPFNPATALRSALVDLNNPLNPPPVCLSIMQQGMEATIGTLGNFSMIIGKAKSRKTFFITMALAAATKNDLVLGQFKGCLPANRSTVLFFDTEQAEYHVQLAARRICSLTGQEVPQNLLVYGLRKYKPAERLKMIEYAIYHTSNVGLVVIDGVRDLITSINDEEQATSIGSDFLRWTEEKYIHLIGVLHQNKGDQHARGHLGTELQNKAETVLSVTKDSENKDISIVQAEFCRDREPEPFAFSIDENGLPIIVDNWELKTPKTKANNLIPSGHDKDWHAAFLKEVFSKNDNPKYGELMTAIKDSFKTYNKSIGDTKAKNYITYYSKEGMIEKIGKERSPNAYYTVVGIQ